MKRTTMNMMLATAALLVASAAASAQTLTAEIPFGFSAAGKLMPAGTYEVFASNGEQTIRLLNPQAKESVMVVGGIPQDPQKAWTAMEGGVLQFDCADGCTLRTIWTRRGFPAHQVGASQRAGQPTRLAVIRLTTGSSK